MSIRRPPPRAKDHGREDADRQADGTGRSKLDRPPRFGRAHVIAPPDEAGAEPAADPEQRQQQVAQHPGQRGSSAQVPAGRVGEGGFGAVPDGCEAPGRLRQRQSQSGKRHRRTPRAAPAPPDQDLQCVVALERSVPQPRPAQLASPYLGGGCGGRAAARTAHRRGERASPAARTTLVVAASSASSAAEQLECRRRFSIWLRRYSIDLPWAKPRPIAVRGVLPARLIGVEERAFELGPESVRPAADGRRRDDARIRPPRRKQALDIVARHQHVAVGHHDPVVGRGRASPCRRC